tara:strand:- start:70 stop:309 length:240 start_codon:yes stop_codon:yes gene_type:complete
MRLQNDITDQFIDAEYQYLTESDSNASLDWLDAVPSDSEDDALSELSVPIYSDKGEHFGGFRSKDFSELNKEPQDFYYD